MRQARSETLKRELHAWSGAEAAARSSAEVSGTRLAGASLRARRRFLRREDHAIAGVVDVFGPSRERSVAQRRSSAAGGGTTSSLAERVDALTTLNLLPRRGPSSDHYCALISKALEPISRTNVCDRSNSSNPSARANLCKHAVLNLSPARALTSASLRPELNMHNSKLLEHGFSQPWRALYKT